MQDRDSDDMYQKQKIQNADPYSGYKQKLCNATLYSHTGYDKHTKKA